MEMGLKDMQYNYYCIEIWYIWNIWMKYIEELYEDAVCWIKFVKITTTHCTNILVYFVILSEWEYQVAELTICRTAMLPVQWFLKY